MILFPKRRSVASIASWTSPPPRTDRCRPLAPPGATALVLFRPRAGRRPAPARSSNPPWMTAIPRRCAKWCVIVRVSAQLCGINFSTREETASPYAPWGRRRLAGIPLEGASLACRRDPVSNFQRPRPTDRRTPGRSGRRRYSASTTASTNSTSANAGDASANANTANTSASASANATNTSANAGDASANANTANASANANVQNAVRANARARLMLKLCTAVRASPEYLDHARHFRTTLAESRCELLQ